MTNLELLYEQVDKLKPDEMTQLQDYLEQRRRRTWWVVPSENLKAIEELLRPVHEEASHMDEAEIDALIDEAIQEVRDERKNQSRS